MDYVNLDLELSNYQKDSSTNQEIFCVHVVRSDCGNMPSDKAVPITLTAEQRKSISYLKQRGLSKEEMIERGEILGKMLVPPNTQVRRIYDTCLIKLEDSQRLRIRLTLGNYALSDLPWEYSYILPPDTPVDQKDLNGFLVLNKNISLVRHPAVEQKVVSLDPVGKGALRMVVVMANPKGDPHYPKLQIEREFEKIQGVFKEMPSVVPEPHPGATREALQDALMTPAHIFHFAGHGDFEGDLGSSFKSTSGQGYIILLDDEGKGVKFPADELADFLRGSQVRLAVLTACETGSTDQINAWTGVVPALIQAGIPAVVGMQFSIQEENAIAFSRQFYLALARGLSIDAAVEEGRLAIPRKDERDWGVPVLYLQSDEGVLFPALAQPPDNIASIKEALENVIDSEIAANRRVRDAVSLSKARLADTTQQIGEMELFKTVHDAFHVIEHDCLLPMKDKNATFKTYMPRYKREFGNQANRIRTAIKEFETNSLLEDLIKDVTDLLDRAAKDFDTIDNMPANAVVSEKSVAFKSLIGDLEQLLAGLPSHFNTNILEAARNLNLDRLVTLLTDVRDALSTTYPEQDVKIELLTRSIFDLDRFKEELVRRVKEHNRLQILDQKLRTVCVGRTVQNRDVESEWRRIKELRAKIEAPFSPALNDQNAALIVIENDIEDAISRKNENDARKQLKEYFREVGKVFRDVDNSLKVSCATLNLLSKPLNAVLDKC
jgi:hypothetical protein